MKSLAHVQHSWKAEEPRFEPTFYSFSWGGQKGGTGGGFGVIIITNISVTGCLGSFANCFTHYFTSSFNQPLGW